MLAQGGDPLEPPHWGDSMLAQGGDPLEPPHWGDSMLAQGGDPLEPPHWGIPSPQTPDGGCRPPVPPGPQRGGSPSWRGVRLSWRGQATRVLTAEVSSAMAFLASAKYMLVLGLKYSSFSRPA